MITVEEASGIINKNLFEPDVIKIPMSKTLGRVLAEDISADRDFPPFDRVMMDGIAIQYQAFEKGQRKYKREGIQLAGEAQKELKDSDGCYEVMTGAMLPNNTDTVIPYEELKIGEQHVLVRADSIRNGQNIHTQGSDVELDDVILTKGCLISTAEIGVLATVGKSEVSVLSLPRVAIISTGDELVPVQETPREFQIRQSNSHVLCAALNELGVDSAIFHILDEKELLFQKLKSIIEEFDVLILSGGVSKGKKDYVPEVLGQLKFEKQFHGVIQRPGKPFWFGTRHDNKTVFALPGNPVSTYMCFQKYINPWIYKSMQTGINVQYAILAEDFLFKPNLTYFLQVKIRNINGQLMAQPVAGQGSGDLANLISADGFLELPSDTIDFKQGDSFPFIRYRRV